MSFSVALKTRNWASEKNIPVHFVGETASTNSLAKENLDSSSQLFLATHQTQGRGRRQNQWLTADPLGQLFSTWVFSLKTAPQPVISPLVGLALFHALEQTYGKNFALKAPNDLFCGDLKVAGILIESIQNANDYRLIIGIGMNVSSKPPLQTAGALTDIIPESVLLEKWELFLDSLFANLSRLSRLNAPVLTDLQRKDLLQALNQFSLLKEKYVDVLEDGSLQLKSKLIHWSDL